MPRAGKKRPISSGAPAGRGSTEAFRETRRQHAGELAEDYVELIDDLIHETGEARLVDIARRMGVAHVTANHTVRRLQRDGLVEKLPYRSIFLTAKGRKLAIESRNRHDIVFRFLLSIGVPERQAAIDAEGIEHHISDTTLRILRGRVLSMRKNGQP
jgi:DtxR family manganese transport transcriptional regulator